MNIKKKIKFQRDEILKDPDGAGGKLADEIALAGKDAILAGMRNPDGSVTPEWEKMMTYFKNDKQELDRLCGKDEKFNESRWGLQCLAYIAGNSLCTITTVETGGTLRNFTDVMKYNLDAEDNPQKSGTEDLDNYKTKLFKKK